MIQTVPKRSFLAAFSARLTSRVKTDAARPYGTPFAQAIASSSSLNFCTVTTGPKTSFWTISRVLLDVGDDRSGRRRSRSTAVRVAAGENRRLRLRGALEEAR